MIKTLLIHCWLLLALSGELLAQTTTAFRKNYDQALFDLPGNIVEGLTPSTYVLAGTNLDFLPIYGTVSQLNDTGGVIWSYRYSDASIGFQLNDIKKDVAASQYYLCGGSESNAAVFMTLDPAGNILISKKFSILEANSAWFNRVVKTSDGGYVAAGYVTGYDPDGAGPEIKFDPITWTSSTNGTTHTDAIRSPLIVKLDASGNHVWHRVFRYYTASTKDPSERIYNNASFTDVVEVSDGYVAVGSYDVNQHRSVTSGDDEDDATPTDALILKTTTAGVITYHKQIDNPSTSTSQSSKYLGAVNTTSAGAIITAGSDNSRELIQKFAGSGGFSNTFSRLFTYSQTFFINDPVDVSQIYEVDGGTDLVTMSMYIKPLSFFANAIHRVNSTASSNVWAKRYDFNLISILPKGGKTSDNGYIAVSMTAGGTNYDYHVIKTDPNGDTPTSGCPAASFTPSAASGPTTFADPYYNSWSGTPGANTIGISRTSITLTPAYICTKTTCTPPSAATTVTATPDTICAGQLTTITASGPSTSVVYNVYTAASGGTSIGAAPLTVSPGATITYYIETALISDPTCVSTTRTPVTVTVNPAPTVTANASPSNSICVGDQVTLTGGGAASYTWDNGVTDGVTFTPSSTTTYTVTGTDGNGCTNTAQITVTVNSAPTVTANASPSSTICSGGSVTLTGSGATTYSWDNGVTDGVAFTPSTTTTYTVTGSTGSCTDTDQITITVNTAPTVTASATATTICAGDAVTLTGGGAASYTWDSGVIDGVSFTPAATTTYTVTGTATNGCTNTAQITVTVNTAPTVIANASPSTAICAGNSVTLTGSGATSYSWDNGVTDGVAFTPVTTTTYTVTGSNGSCTGTAQITITVNPAPTVTANAGPSNSICVGDQVTLTGGGAASYTWNNGVTDGIAFTPAATTTYTVTGTDGNGCTNTAQITVTVSPAPIVTANASPSSAICAGSSVTLTGSGATTYSWDNGVTDGVAFTPSTTTTYTVTGSTGSCTDTDQITITVNTAPTVTASATATTICAGDAVTLTGGGAVSYTWDNGVIDGVSFTPTATITYTVTGTGVNGCTNTASVNIIVNPLPTISFSGQTSICEGETTTLTAFGGSSYLWNNGVSVDNVIVSPATSSTYTVTVTDANGCTDSSDVTVVVNQSPVATISGNTNMCGGQEYMLTAGTGNNYLWNTGDTISTLVVSINSDTVYSVFVFNGTCSDSASINIELLDNPDANAGSDVLIYQGQSTTLTATGGENYAWSPAFNLTCNNCASPVANPESTTTYCVTVTDANGCADTACVTIRVDFKCGDLFVPTVFSPNDDGLNDQQCVMGNCIETMLFTIYSRWGEKVFETNDPQVCWDGTLNGKLINTSVFVYVLEATLTNGETISQKGNFTLVR